VLLLGAKQLLVHPAVEGVGRARADIELARGAGRALPAACPLRPSRATPRDRPRRPPPVQWRHLAWAGPPRSGLGRTWPSVPRQPCPEGPAPQHEVAVGDDADAPEWRARRVWARWGAGVPGAGARWRARRT
jgi:hypothetical protein